MSSWPGLDVTTLGTLTPDEILSVNATTDYAASIPRCSLCGQTEALLKRKLKRCSGCSMAKYCSKECQREAWASHKESCRPADDFEGSHDDDRPLGGYKSVSAATKAIKHWIESFGAVTYATILLNNGAPIGHSLTNCTWVFKFTINLGIKHEPGTGGNPAEAFLLHDVSLVKREELGPLCGDAGTWNTITALCREEAEYRRQEGSPPVPIFPAIFLVMGTGVAIWRQFPVFLPPRPLGDTFAFDETSRAVIADTRRMCIEAMRSGVIFRLPETNKPMPDIGTLVKRGKKWTWEGRDDHPFWVALARRISRSGSLYESGLAPLEIWTRFHRL